MKKISLILVALCMLLCLVFAVSCGGNDTDTDTSTNTDTGSNADTNTDTGSNTDTDSDTTDTDEVQNEYRIYVVDKNGNPIKLAHVTYCDYVETQTCQTGFTNADGYIVVPNANYHVSAVTPTTDHEGISGVEIHFEEGSKTITVTLEDKAE